MEPEVNVADLIARLEEKGVRLQTVGRKAWVPREQWGKLTPEERSVCSDHNVRERMAVELGRRMATPHQAPLTRVPMDSDEDNVTLADIEGQDPSTVYAGKLIEGGEWLLWGMR